MALHHRFLGLFLAAAGVTGCYQAPATPPGLEPTPIKTRLADFEEVEELTEEIANRLIECSDALRKKDYRSAGNYLSADFRGTPFCGLESDKQEALPLGGTRVEYRIKKDALNARRFLESLEGVLAPLESVEFVFFKTRGAELETDKSRGVLQMTANIIGRLPGGKPYSLNGWAKAEVKRQEGKWVLDLFALDRLLDLSIPAALFTDVAPAAGHGEVRAQRRAGAGVESLTVAA